MLTHQCQCCNCGEVFDIDEYMDDDNIILTIAGENDINQYEKISDVHCPKCSSTEKVELEVY